MIIDDLNGLNDGRTRDVPDIERQQLRPRVSAALDKVQSEILLGVGQITEEQLGDGLQSTLSGRQGGQGRPEDPEGAHHLWTDVQLGHLQGSQGFEGEEVKLELVWYQLAASYVLLRPNNTESLQLAAGVGHVGEVQPLVLGVHWRTRALQSLAD